MIRTIQTGRTRHIVLEESISLNMPEIEYKPQDPPCHQRAGIGTMVACLLVKPFAPDGHLPSTVGLNLLTAINGPIDPPEGKRPAVSLAQLRQVSMLDRQDLRHWPVSFSLLPMAGRTTPLKFKLSASDDFCLLPRGHCRGPQDDGNHKPKNSDETLHKPIPVQHISLLILYS